MWSACEAGEVEPIGQVRSVTDNRVAMPVDAQSRQTESRPFQEAEGVNGQIVIALTNRIVTQLKRPATRCLRNGSRLLFRDYEIAAPSGNPGSCYLHSLSSEFDTSSCSMPDRAPAHTIQLSVVNFACRAVQNGYITFYPVPHAHA